MKYFPDEPASDIWTRYAVLALPLAYLIVALLYSANSAPWGRQVDPESAYAMNGLAWSVGYPMLKSDHPGTTTILLVGIVIRVWAFIVGRSDVIEFGLKNFDAIIYASRAAEVLIMSGALLASGVIVRNATRSSFAAMLFQVAPFASGHALHFQVMLMPDSLMASCAMFGMALVLKAALGERAPTIGLGAVQGLIYALGLSSKILSAPLAIMTVSLLRNRWAVVAAVLSGIFSFFIFNRILHPLVFTSGFRWLVDLATHKGTYGEGERGFVDLSTFWPNMGQIILAEPVISAVFAIGAGVALARMVTSRRFLDPISLTLVAAFLAFSVQLVATSKHFGLHYMLAAWVLTGGVLVLTVIETRRLFPKVSPRATVGAAALVCVVLISATLVQVRSEAFAWIAQNNIGARLSKAVVAAGPSCANVSAMFVRAPEHDMNYGGDVTFGVQEMEDRFSEAYERAFNVPLLDHSNYYRGTLMKNFRPHTYRQLASEYPCIVVRTPKELNQEISYGLLDLKPEHCVVESIHIYAAGISCEKIRQAFQDTLSQ